MTDLIKKVISIFSGGNIFSNTRYIIYLPPPPTFICIMGSYGMVINAPGKASQVTGVNEPQVFPGRPCLMKGQLRVGQVATKRYRSTGGLIKGGETGETFSLTQWEINELSEA